MSLKKGLQKAGRTPAFTFDLCVPPDGRQDRSPLTVLGDCRWDGRTLVEVALDHWNPKDKPPNYYIFVERRFAPCYAV
jgi:hypothetical protein